MSTHSASHTRLHECSDAVKLTSRSTDDVHTTQTSFSASAPKPNYKAYCFDQPTSHFDAQHNATFCQRYWIDASSYKTGGPIFVLDGGETSGADRYVYIASDPSRSPRDTALKLIAESRFYDRASWRSFRMRQAACRSCWSTDITASLSRSRRSRPTTSAS